MKRRLLAIFLSVAMICSFAPAALAEESDGSTACTLTEGCTLESGHEGDCVVAESTGAEEDDGTEDDGSAAAIAAVQELIDALPDAEDITEDTMAEVEALLDAIDVAKSALYTDYDLEPTEVLDLAKYDAACAALEELYGQAGASTPMLLAEEADGLPEADEDGVITLNADVEISSATSYTENTTIDLNGYTLTYSSNVGTITVSEGATLSIYDSSATGTGKLILNNGKSTTANINVQTGSTVIVKDIDVEATGSVFFPQGDAAAVTIENCIVTTTGVYCVGTNAATTDNYNVAITISGSTLTAYADGGDDCAVLINVTGTLTIDDSTIIGDRQAVVVRAGDATITDSTITVTGKYTNVTDRTATTWGSGNEVASGAVVVGNLNGTYYDDATVELVNTVVTGSTNDAAIYVDSNSNYSGSITISGDDTKVTGKVTTGQSTEGSSSISITGGTYDTDVSAYVADGYQASKNSSGYYEVTTAPLAASVETNSDGTTTVSISGSLLSGLDQTNSSEFVDGTNDQSTEIIVDATTASGESTATEIAITGTALDSISHINTAAETLTINSDVGTLSLDADALAAMTENATDTGTGTVSDIVISIAVDTGTNNPIYTITAEDADGNEIFDSSNAGGTVTITVSYETDTQDPTIVVYYTDNGLEDMNATYEYDTASKAYIVSWNTSHFSTYEILDIDPNSTEEVVYNDGSGVAYDTLANAITACSSDGAIITLGDCTLESAIPANTTLTVSDSTMLTVGSNYLAILGGSSGTLIVEAGGTLSVNSEVWIGSGEGNLQLEDGTVTVDLSDIKNGIAVTLDGEATVADYWTLKTGTVNMNLTVSADSTLTIADGGQLAVANGSTLTNNGTISVESDGVLRVNSQGTLTGAGTVNNAGSVTVHTDGTNDAKVECTINIVSSGAVYSQLADNTDLEAKLSGSYKSSTGTYTVTGVTDDGTTGTLLEFSTQWTLISQATPTLTLSSSSGSVYTTAGTTTFTFTYAGDGTVTVTSSDESVATASVDGTTVTLTILAAGSTTITVSASETDAYTAVSATYSLTVSKKSSGSGGSSSSSSSTYSITVEDSDNGSVSSNRSSASKGTTVTLTISPDDGYELDELTVTNASTGDTISLTQSSSTKYTFSMPSAKVTVAATFVESENAGTGTDSDLVFVDVDEGDYYYDAVVWAVENGITTGTSATTFSPDASCTRAQMVTFLWRAAGSPVPSSTSCSFTDLDSSDYYYTAVLWAVENGITNGTSDTTFSPNATVTRSQTVALLYRYDGSNTPTGTLPYTDVSTDAYYYNAVLWAKENDITNGTTETTFSPEDNCTRAQIVTFLYRYMA